LKASKKFDKSGKELMSKTFELLDDGSKKIVTIKDGVTSVVTQAPKAV
jgi:hypothetical protein